MTAWSIAAGAPLEHLPVLIDEEVVADVVPAVGVAVVLGDAEHDRGRLVGRVVVGGDRVVHEAHLHHAVAGRRARRDRVAAPRRARDDRRRGARRAACCLGATATRARSACRAAAGTATKCTRSGARRRPEKRSCSSSQPPAQTGSEARSPLPVSGAWSPWTASATHGLHCPPRGRTRTSKRPRAASGPRTPSRSKRRGARSTRLVAPSKSRGRTLMPKPRARAGAGRPKALNGRASSDPSPAAAPRTRARRRVIVVAPTAARVARAPEGATRARSPATRPRTRSGAPSCGRVGGAGARRRRRRAGGPAPARCRTRRPASARRSSACPR